MPVFFYLRDCRHSRFFFFIIFTNNFKTQYTLSNIAIVMKHQSKNLYPKFYKPLGFFHVLDLDFMVYDFCYHSKV